MAVIKSNSITFVDNAGVEKYLYVRYSNDGKTFTENNGTTPGSWLGVCPSSSPTAPTDFNLYTWSEIQGNDGQTLYTWIKYADDENGTNMSDDPNGKTYMGIAYNKESLEESLVPGDYNWSLITNRGIDRIEEYYTATANSTDMPDFSDVEPNDIPILNSTNSKYLWNKEITYFTDGDTDETEAVIIGVYGDTGAGIKDIENYYTTTTEINATPAFPDKPNEPPQVSAENKYLWNYEKIIYTEGPPTTTTPAIIGVYGDKGDVGEGAILFKIYSSKGFQFIDSMDESERVDTITLQVAAFQGTTPITNAIYKWSWYDPNIETYTKAEVTSASSGEYWVSDNEGYASVTLPGGYDSTLTYYTRTVSSGYVEISSSSFLEVSRDSDYALANIKCEMTPTDHTGEPYVEHVTLTEKTDVYMATIKFFEGTNVFSQGQEVLVAYTELYKNRELEEGLKEGINKYVEVADINNINYTPQDDEDAIYFLYKNENDDYEIVLGRYNISTWSLDIDNQIQYTYVNSLNQTTNSNIFIVKKSDVTRSMNLNVDIYSSSSADPSTFITSTAATIVDLNDVVVGAEPNSPYHGQLWFDTEHNTLWVYDSTKDNGSEQDKGGWEPSSKQMTGKSVHTSKPNSYQEGDLWILDNDESITLTVDNVAIEYGPGSLLRAKNSSSSIGFMSSDWEDAMSDVTNVVRNVQEYMTFDPGRGLKISQKDNELKDKFYVNISSTRMSFCSLAEEEDTNPYIPEGEVVHISGNSASITNLEVERSMDCNCPIEVDTKIDLINTYDTASSFPGFVFQIEEEGGFSLVKKLKEVD